MPDISINDYAFKEEMFKSFLYHQTTYLILQEESSISVKRLIGLQTIPQVSANILQIRDIQVHMKKEF